MKAKARVGLFLTCYFYKLAAKLPEHQLPARRLLPATLFFTLFFASCFCLTATPLRADEGADWAAFNVLSKKLEALQKTEPQAALEAWQQFLQARPNLTPTLVAYTHHHIAELLGDALHAPDQALQSLDVALQRLKDDPASVIVLESKAKLLLQNKRAEEVEALLRDKWPLVLQAANGSQSLQVIYASWLMSSRSEALQAQGKRDEAIAMLQTTMQSAPVYLLDTRRQGSGGWREGWMFEQMVGLLAEAGKADEALQWAKLSFVVAKFDKASVEQATRLLSAAWLAKGQYDRARAFAQAQRSAPKPATPNTENPPAADKAADKADNPLQAIALPQAARAVAQAQAAQWQQEQKGQTGRLMPVESYAARDPAHEAISALLILGRHGEAMQIAQRLLVGNREAAWTVAEVCRVFKGADGSVRRANEFLSFMNGQGRSPLPEFFREHEPANAAADATGGGQ